MQFVISLIQQHVLLIVFLNILLAESGLPLPVFPTLMTASALAGQNPSQIAGIIVAGLGGALLGDFVPYCFGRYYGRHVLGLLCRVSFSPDFCVRRTETVFAKIGPWSLLFSKFIPGFSLISVAMAGVSRMVVPLFVLLDGTGKLLYVGAAVALGRIFQNAIASVLATLAELGKFGVVAVLAAFGLYILAKWVRRQLFIRQLRMDRITVDELRELIDDGQDLTILDVRPRDVRALDGIIPGALPAHPSDSGSILADHPRDVEIVVYCDCPNEASAAIAANHLKQAGFKKIRPLFGGIDAWVEAGQPLQGGQVATPCVQPVLQAAA
jgi:membrane protein DedA with SNARE-associated domain/rhodanese-related sulfurtransferase